MSKRIFNLKSVPEDEAEDIKNIFIENDIDFFESPAGNWGISVHALWLKDETQTDLAKHLISDYQQERSKRFKLELEEKKASGDYETLMQRVLRNPLQFISLFVIVAFVLYLSVIPFFNLA